MGIDAEADQFVGPHSRNRMSLILGEWRKQEEIARVRRVLEKLTKPKIYICHSLCHHRNKNCRTWGRYIKWLELKIDKCTHTGVLSRPTNAQNIYINILTTFIYRKYCYTFRCTCIIFRETFPSTLLKLQKSLNP